MQKVLNKASRQASGRRRDGTDPLGLRVIYGCANRLSIEDGNGNLLLDSDATRSIVSKKNIRNLAGNSAKAGRIRPSECVPSPRPCVCQHAQALPMSAKAKTRPIHLCTQPHPQTRKAHAAGGS